MKAPYWTVLAAMMFLAVGVWAVCAQGKVEVSDDFSAYTAGSDASPRWQPVSGKWAVRDGAYVQSDIYKTATYSFLKEPVVSDFMFTARFYVYPEGGGVKAAGLVFRSTSSADCYFAHFDSRNSQLLLYLNRAGGKSTELARVKNLPIEAGKWHTARISCEGPKISVYLDGKLVTEVEDGALPAGRVGLRTGQGHIAFDDVQLSGTQAVLEKEWTIMPESVAPDESDVPKLEAAEHIVAERGGGYFPVLIKLNDGRIAAVVRGGAPHIGIKGRLDWIESSDSGRTWSEPKIIVDSEWDDRNPAMGQMPDGTIVMAYAEARTYNEKGEWDTSAGEYVLFYVLSKDGGKTWSQKRKLFTGPIRGGSPFGKIIVLEDGTALMSLYGGRDPDYKGPVQLPEGASSLVGIVRSHDNGETWEDFSLVSASGHNETALLAMPDGSIIAQMRTNSGAIDQTVSTDGGRTWSKPVRITREKQHPADIIRLQSGHLLLVYGNRMVPFGVGAMLSYDEGKTWDYDHRVMLGWTSLGGDCGYPSAVQLDDGTIVCMYYSVGTYDLPGDQQALVVRFTEQQLQEAGRR